MRSFSFAVVVVSGVAEGSSDRGGSLEIQFVMAVEFWSVQVLLILVVALAVPDARGD